MTHAENSGLIDNQERDATLLIEDVDDVSVDDYQKDGKSNLLKSTFSKLYNKAFVNEKQEAPGSRFGANPEYYEENELDEIVREH